MRLAKGLAPSKSAGFLTRELMHETRLSLADLGPMPVQPKLTFSPKQQQQHKKKRHKSKPVSNTKFMSASAVKVGQGDGFMPALVVPLDNEWPQMAEVKPKKRIQGLTFESFEVPPTPKASARSEMRDFWTRCKTHYNTIAKPAHSKLTRSREDMEEKKRKQKVRVLLEKLEQKQRKVQREQYMKKLKKARMHGEAKVWKLSGLHAGQPTLKVWTGIQDELSRRYEEKVRQSAEASGSADTVHYHDKMNTAPDKKRQKKKFVRTLDRVESLDAAAMELLYDNGQGSTKNAKEEGEDARTAALKKHKRRMKRLRQRIAEREATEEEYKRILAKRANDEENAYLESQWGVHAVAKAPKNVSKLLHDAQAPFLLTAAAESFPWSPTHRSSGAVVSTSRRRPTIT